MACGHVFLCMTTKRKGINQTPNDHCNSKCSKPLLSTARTLLVRSRALSVGWCVISRKKKWKRKTGYFAFKFRVLFLKMFTAHSPTNTFDRDIFRPNEIAGKRNENLMLKIRLRVFVVSIFVSCNLTFRWKSERRTHTAEEQKTLKRQAVYFHFFFILCAHHCSFEEN